MSTDVGSRPVAGAESRIDTATVLFTDLVGSTALRSRLGEEAADELRVKHDTLIRDAIGANRGMVVKHTGDGVMATFSAAVDAVAAAVAIQQAVDGHNRRSDDERIEVRVGISVGDVTFEGDDCFGLPVIEAQRLEAAADGGQILCAEIVRHLARGRGGHEFESVGELELKGIPEPVPAVAVRWEPVVQVAMAARDAVAAGAGRAVGVRPRRPRRRARSCSSTRGRRAPKGSAAGRADLGRARHRQDAPRDRDRARRARSGRARARAVAATRSSGLPYQPFVEALRFQSELPTTCPTAWLGPLAGELARLVPGARRPGRRARSRRCTTIRSPSGRACSRRSRVAAHDGRVGAGAARARRPALGRPPDPAARCATSCTRPRSDRCSSSAPTAAPTSTGRTRSRRRSPSCAVTARVTRLAVDGLTADGVAELLERAAGHELDDAGHRARGRGVRRDRRQPVLRRRDRAPPGGERRARPARRPVDQRPDPGATSACPKACARSSAGASPGSTSETQRAAVGRRGDRRRVRRCRCSPRSRASTRTTLLDRLDTRAVGRARQRGRSRPLPVRPRARCARRCSRSSRRPVACAPTARSREAIEARHAGDLDAGGHRARVPLRRGRGRGDPGEGGGVRDARRRPRPWRHRRADDAVRWYALALEHLDGDGDEVATDVDLLTRLAEAELVGGGRRGPGPSPGVRAARPQRRARRRDGDGAAGPNADLVQRGAGERSGEDRAARARPGAPRRPSGPARAADGHAWPRS